MSDDHASQAINSLPLPPEVVRAVKALDPDGGWDHETTGGWPDMALWRDLRRAEDGQYVERSTAYGIECWRLTDEGIALRAALI